MEQMARRQATLESRQSVIASLGAAGAQSRSTASRNAPSLPGATPAATAPAATRPQPVGDTVRIGAPMQRQSQLESRRFTVATAPAAGVFALVSHSGSDDRLSHLSRSLDSVERQQADILQTLELGVDRRTRKIRLVLAELGIDHRRARPARTDEASGTGGPLIPLPQTAVPAASPFERQVFRLQSVIRDEEQLMRIVDAIPFGRPHAGDLELSSGFGARLDPFLRTWALHSGVDFRGATGEPVFAAASGRVAHAGSMGGYGLLVEIDHGNGLTTRYAHLSRIHVKEGDMIRTGQRIGRVGSTGRSTGPHLHYETRVNGEAVDPMRYLRAGVRLAGAL
ncbi:M23 family metallopeptidase [Phreatobacter sp.]|uniref:M23 family metallopeptidase n=1 Tax=Phreatobacter sp. TaxID=1966341 RepID=UPI003F719A7D